MRNRLPVRLLPAVVLVGLGLAGSGPETLAGEPPFEWRDGDRVVLVGDDLVERDQQFGYLETRVVAANPGKRITFRNLGWAGDTAAGLARSGFDPPTVGTRRLRELVAAHRPTVLIVGYGMADSFAGPAGLPAFTANLDALLDAAATEPTRVIFLSPVAHEDLGRPLPDPAPHNGDLRRYRDAVKALAGRRGGRFIDLYDATEAARDSGISPLSADGIHPTAFGDWYLASVIAGELQGTASPEPWFFKVDGARVVVEPAGFTVHSATAVGAGARLNLTAPALPPPPAPSGSPEGLTWGDDTRVLALQFTDRKPWAIALQIDGRPIAADDPGNWAQGLPLTAGPEVEQVEALRRAIIAKNRLYFYRWRPQNETYLFGFRKHEQGNNAREVPLFDPLVAAKEQEIDRLQRPTPHDYQLTRGPVDGPGR